MDNQEIRASEKSLRLKTNAVSLVMRKKPWTVEHIISKLLAIKVLSTDGRTFTLVEGTDEGKAPDSFVVAAAKVRARTKRPPTEVDGGEDTPVRAKKSRDDDDADTELQAIASDPIPSKYSRIGALGVAMMQEKLLTPMESTIFSPDNCKTLAPYGLGFTKNQMELSKYIEFASGIQPNFPLSGNWADFRNLTPAVQFLNIKRGRRSMRLQFPVDWPSMGEYVPKEHDKKRRMVTVYKVHEQVSEEISTDKLPRFNKLSDLIVNYNWSEKRATLSVKNNPSPSDPELFTFFMRHVQDVPMPVFCDLNCPIALADAPAKENGDEDESEESEDEPDNALEAPKEDPVPEKKARAGKGRGSSPAPASHACPSPPEPASVHRRQKLNLNKLRIKASKVSAALDPEAMLDEALAKKAAEDKQKTLKRVAASKRR